MCHVVLLMPIIGLAVFWLWPLHIAVPVYAVIALISGLIYFVLIRAMQRPVVTGKEGLIGMTAEIIDTSGSSGHVKVHGEIWEAAFEDTFNIAEKGRIKDIQGKTLILKK